MLYVVLVYQHFLAKFVVVLVMDIILVSYLNLEFNSTELWGRFYAGKKFQLFAFVPYNHFKQIETGVTTIEQGIGDITLAANYTIFNTADDLSKDFKQTVLLGGGVKLPTGNLS